VKILGLLFYNIQSYFQTEQLEVENWRCFRNLFFFALTPKLCS